MDIFLCGRKPLFLRERRKNISTDSYHGAKEKGLRKKIIKEIERK
jgi:hypothetical protein